LALSAKGKTARILDKKRDSGEVMKLIERVKQAISIYQVCPWGPSISWRPLTSGTGFTTTVNARPTLPLYCEFSSRLRLRGEPLCGWFQSYFDAVLKVSQVREHEYDQGQRTNLSQKPPTDKKIGSLRVKLDHLMAESENTTSNNPDDFNRRKVLYECVFSICRITLPVKPTLELSRISK
jgi:hypothetical protein